MFSYVNSGDDAPPADILRALVMSAREMRLTDEFYHDHGYSDDEYDEYDELYGDEDEFFDDDDDFYDDAEGYTDEDDFDSEEDEDAELSEEQQASLRQNCVQQ